MFLLLAWPPWVVKADDIAVVHPLKYVRFLKTTKTFTIIATSWTIPFLFVTLKLMVYLPNSVNFVTWRPVFVATYTVFFAVLPTVLLFVLHIRILLTAWKLSREKKVLFTDKLPYRQTRWKYWKLIRNVGLKPSTVRLVTVLVTIFMATYRIVIHSAVCYYFNLCDDSTNETMALHLLLLANSTLRANVNKHQTNSGKSPKVSFHSYFHIL